MHIKEYNGIEIKFTGPNLHQDEIDSLMYFLHNQLEEINNYSDKSLFFQNPEIIDCWLALVRTIEKIETWEAAEDKTKWEDRTETYVAYLLTLRDYYFKYQKLYRDYFEQLSKILECYGGWLEGDCVSADGIEALSADHYCDDLEDVDDIIQHLTKLNNDSLKARFSVHSVLTDILGIMLSVMNRGSLKITGMNPSTEDFAKAIDDDLREWTFSFGEDMFREMKEDLNRHFKAYRTAPYTPELWGELLAADEEALNLAKKKELADCDTEKQEHWGEDMKKQMDENSELMQLIYSSCRTDELFDLRMADNQQQIISLLTPENLSMFYDIIVRRNLIQCKMFPELKNQHEEWLKGEEKNDADDSTEEELNNPKDELNFFAPKKNLQELLKGAWFAEVRSDEKYDSTWTDQFIVALMASEYGEGIARDWAVKGAREKKNQLKAYVVGLLKDVGVLKGSYPQIGNKTGLNNKKRTFSTNMSRGKKQPYADWVKEYVKG